MKKINFSNQVTLMLVVACVITFTCSLFISLFNIKSSLTKAAEQKIDEILEISMTLVNGYQARVKSGELSVAQAKQMALKDLSTMKYQGKNYLWVMTDDCIYLYHPSRPVNFDGKTLKNSKGRHYIEELGKNAVEKNGKFIYDASKKPGTEDKTKYPKIMKGLNDQTWGWTIATGIYIDDINKIVVTTFLHLLLINLGVLVVILLLIHWLFTTKSLNEVTSLAYKLKSNADEVAKEAVSLKDESMSLTSSSDEQASSIQETSATVEETSSMVEQNNSNTKMATTLAKSTKQEVMDSVQAIKIMIETMKKLELSSLEISKIIKTIDDIAFQTNILSLNAAVEAARAGDSGKGFAVVAEEVRNLAQRSADAAKDTEAIIASNINLSKESCEKAQEIDKKLDIVNEDIVKVDALLDEISAATNEQAQGIRQLNQAINNLERGMQTSASAAGNTSTSSAVLSEQVEIMNEIIENLVSLLNGK